MLRYTPANISMPVILPPRLGQAMPISPISPAPAVPGSKWLLNLGILASGLGIGFLGISNHTKPLGILAIQAGGSIVGAAFVLFVMDSLSPQTYMQTAAL